MASYVVRCRNVRHLVQRWKELAPPTGDDKSPRFDHRPDLFDHLAAFRRIEWFYYNDKDYGVTIRLYDTAFAAQDGAAQHGSDFIEKGNVVLRGHNLGAESGPLKVNMLQLFDNQPAEKRMLPDDAAKRTAFFEALNNGHGATDPEPAGTGPTPLDDPFGRLVGMLPQFRQVILYGPPGTGKTRLARRAALALLQPGSVGPATTDEEVEEALRRVQSERERRFDLVVFHPSYEYEQFVGGITAAPTAGGHDLHYDVKPGVFLDLCCLAPRHPCAVLIIDEINRGNLPKLLGELVYALEYRGGSVRLPFDYRNPASPDEPRTSSLTVPRNLFIIATMNSSDRSIGHIDAAVRRRFALMPVYPDGRVVEGIWQRAGRPAWGQALGRLMTELNEQLGAGELGREIGVGHSYFLCDAGFAEPGGAVDLRAQVLRKWHYQVLPLLEEYQHLTPLDPVMIDQYTRRIEAVLATGANEPPALVAESPDVGLADQEPPIEFSQMSG